MTIKIDKKITGYEVVKEEPKRADSNVVHMHEKPSARRPCSARPTRLRRR